MKGRIECRRKPRACPVCASSRIATILFGMPMHSADLEEDLASGRIVLGGCCIGDDDAVWKCLECDMLLHRGSVNRVWPLAVEALDGETEPMPSRTAVLPLDRSFSEEQMEIIRSGCLPDEMDDEWFLYWQDDALHCHRGGKGHCIYVVRFEPKGDTYCMVEAEVNRDRSQYDWSSKEADQEGISKLLDKLLVQRG